MAFWYQRHRSVADAGGLDAGSDASEGYHSLTCSECPEVHEHDPVDDEIRVIALGC